MSESKRAMPLASRELMGMVLFALSAFPVVLVGLAMIKGVEGEAAGMRAFAQQITGAIGYVPALVCFGGFALVGGGLALSNQPVDAGRHLAGFLFTSVGVAVCLGTLRSSTGGDFLHGGSFGDATGGNLASIAQWAGLLVGGAVTFASVWLAWLGGAQGTGVRFQGNQGQTPTLSDALSERDSDGVSSAEANALVPDEETLTYMEELWRKGRGYQQPEPIPPSPYPDDVRSRGGIPEGAAVLPTEDDSTDLSGEADYGAPSWRPAEAVREADHAPSHDLATTVEPESGTNPGVVQGQAPAEAVARPEVTPLGSPTSVEAKPLTEEPSAGPPRPAWEQGAMFEEPSKQEAPEEEDLVVDELEEELVEAEEEPEAELEEDELEEAEDDEEAEEEDEDPEAELEEEEDELEEEDSEEEVAAELEEEEELEEEPEEELAAELEDEEEEEEAEEEEEELAAELDEEDELEEELEDDEEEEEEEAAELEEEEEEELEEEPAAELDEDEEEEEEDEYEEEDEEAELEDEPEHVLSPAAPPSEAAPAAAAEGSSPEILHEAGMLFLEHGRVAVSLLQRKFGLEFDDACEVLDELQELGLIGPYMGGQKRDILMSVEEWEGRLAGS